MTKQAHYSQEAVDKGHSSSIWSTPDGGEVEASFIGRTGAYRWADSEELGL